MNKKNIKLSIYGFLQNLFISTAIFTFVAFAFAQEKTVRQWENMNSDSKEKDINLWQIEKK